MVCPFCRAAHENSLRITRKVAALTFNCFRASCGARGAIQSNGGTQLHSYDTEQRTKSNPFTLDTCSPPESLVELLGSRYGVSREILHYSGMKWASSESSMCFPVFDIEGNKTGTTTKVLGELNGKRKSTVYYDDEPPPYYTMRKYAGRSRVCWLVEDVLSCLRLFSEGATSIALLGTNVSHRLFTSLPLYFQKVVIALDPDALAKALKLQQELSILPCTTEVVAFSKDPKDVPREELLAQLEIHGT